MQTDFIVQESTRSKQIQPHPLMPLKLFFCGWALKESILVD